jgi:hypothetical protein
MSVLEMRVAITTSEWDALVTFYRDGLGLVPWNDLNARVTAPDGMQITLFQAMGEPD